MNLPKPGKEIDLSQIHKEGKIIIPIVMLQCKNDQLTSLDDAIRIRQQIGSKHVKLVELPHCNSLSFNLG